MNTAHCLEVQPAEFTIKSLSRKRDTSKYTSSKPSLRRSENQVWILHSWVPQGQEAEASALYLLLWTLHCLHLQVLDARKPITALSEQPSNPCHCPCPKSSPTVWGSLTLLPLHPSHVGCHWQAMCWHASSQRSQGRSTYKNTGSREDWNQHLGS